MQVDAGSDLQMVGALPPLASAAVAGAAGDPMLPMKRAAPEPEMAAPEAEAAPPPLLPVPEAHVTAEEGHFAAAQAQVAAAWEAAAPATFAPVSAAGPVVPMAAQGLVSMAGAAVAVSVTDGPPGKRPRGRAPNGVDGRPKLWDAKKGIWVDQTDPDAANVPDTWDEKMKKNAERQKQRRERGDWNPQDEECCEKYTKNTLKASRIKGDPKLAGLLEQHKTLAPMPFRDMLCAAGYCTTRREITNFRYRQQQREKKGLSGFAE